MTPDMPLHQPESEALPHPMAGMLLESKANKLLGAAGHAASA